jgi:porin
MTGSSQRFAVRIACIAIAAVAGMPSVAAQEWWYTSNDGIPDVSIATSLPHNGDPAGFRKRLSERGIVYGLEYTNDLLSNVRGGNQVGTTNQGKFHGILTVDFGKLVGWSGLSGFVNFFQMHNTGRIRRDYVGGINTIAAIEGVPTTRLSEIWLEQKFASDKASIRFGQLAADAEFFYSEINTLFLQSDWPTIAAVNLPSGGPAYPLSTPGVRLKVDPVKDVSLLLAVFNGDPAGPGGGDPELRNRHGLNFRIRDPALVIGEAQFQRNADKDDTGLATTLKLGGWAHFGKFDDMRFANDGTLLADPAGSGVPLQHRSDYSLYAIIDQQIYRPKGGDAQSGVTLFGRAAIAPSNRNLVDLQADGGIVFAGMIPQRPGDKFGASALYARFSDSVRAFDRDTIALTGAAVPIRDYELNLELTYQAQIVPGWTIQPTMTFIWHPNGDATKNATVAGVRSLLRY